MNDNSPLVSLTADSLQRMLNDQTQLRSNLANLIQGALEPAYCLVILNPVNGEPHVYWNTGSPVPADYILGRGMELLRAVANVQGTPTQPQTPAFHQDDGESNTGTGRHNITEDKGDNGVDDDTDPANEPIPFVTPNNDDNLIQAILEGRD